MPNLESPRFSRRRLPTEFFSDKKELGIALVAAPGSVVFTSDTTQRKDDLLKLQKLAKATIETTAIIAVSTGSTSIAYHSLKEKAIKGDWNIPHPTRRRILQKTVDVVRSFSIYAAATTLGMGGWGQADRHVVQPTIENLKHSSLLHSADDFHPAPSAAQDSPSTQNSKG